MMVVDRDHRIRSDRIDIKKPIIYRMKDWHTGELAAGLLKSFLRYWRTRKPVKIRGPHLDLEENDFLLKERSMDLH